MAICAVLLNFTRQTVGKLKAPSRRVFSAGRRGPIPALIGGLLCALTLCAGASGSPESGKAKARTGRAADVPIVYDSRTPADVRADLETYYQVDRGTFEFELTPPVAPLVPGHIRFASAKPSGDPINDMVYAEWYPSELPGRRPAAIVLHILDGRMRVARVISYFLAAHGVHACLMHLPYYGQRADERGRRHLIEGDLQHTVEAIAQGVADIRRCAAVLRELPDVDKDRVEMIGVSLGAYAAILAAGVDQGFYRTVVVLGGAPIAEAIINGGKESKKIRRKILARGYDEAAIRRLLRPVEPLRYAARVPKGTVTLYAATQDEVIPRECSVRLGRALRMGEKEIRWLKGTHSGVAWMLPLLLPEVARKLDAELTGPSRAAHSAARQPPKP